MIRSRELEMYDGWGMDKGFPSHPFPSHASLQHQRASRVGSDLTDRNGRRGPAPVAQRPGDLEPGAADRDSASKQAWCPPGRAQKQAKRMRLLQQEPPKSTMQEERVVPQTRRK